LRKVFSVIERIIYVEKNIFEIMALTGVIGGY